MDISKHSHTFEYEQAEYEKTIAGYQRQIEAYHQSRRGREAFTCKEQDYCGKNEVSSPSSPAPSSSSKFSKYSSSFNSKNSKFSKEEIEDSGMLRVVALPCKCKSQWCSDCCLGVAVKLREKLRPVFKRWPRVSMITLTVDFKVFESPEAGFHHIHKRRAVTEFLRKMYRAGLLETPEFLKVIEFHKKDDGRIHYHLAVVPTEKWYGKMNSRRANGGKSWLIENWKWGGAYESTRDKNGNEFDPEKAMNYLTKYIIKQEVKPPEWLLKSKFNFRKYETSRGLFGEIKSRTEPKGGTRKTRSIEERIADCGTNTVIVGRQITFEGEGENMVKKVKHWHLANVQGHHKEVEEHPFFKATKDRMENDGKMRWHNLGLPIQYWPTVAEEIKTARDGIDIPFNEDDYEKFRDNETRRRNTSPGYKASNGLIRKTGAERNWRFARYG